MSTEKNNKQAHRFALLAQMDEKVFHASDLASLWEITQKNTLYTTLKRYSVGHSQDRVSGKSNCRHALF